MREQRSFSTPNGVRNTFLEKIFLIEDIENNDFSRAAQNTTQKLLRLRRFCP
jgi:hypothetical protein